jgi:hypothetical protein
MKKARKFEKPEDREKVLNDLVERAGLLKADEKIDATDFCKTHNIVNALFYEVYVSASLILEKHIPHEFTEEKKLRSSASKYAVAGEKGNILIKAPLVTALNEKRGDDNKIKSVDKFTVQDDGETISLTVVK